MAYNVWLDELGIVHLADAETAPISAERGSTILKKSEMEKLLEILNWLEKEKIPYLVFWDWLEVPTAGDVRYWKLCPRVMLFTESDAVYLKMTFSNSSTR